MADVPITVAIVEDDAEVRRGLAFLIGRSPGFQCVAECESAEQARKQLPALSPHVVLMDIGLPGASGIECIRELRDLCPSTEFMMLTVFEDDARIFESLRAGATGYLLKKTSPAKILDSIRDLHEGGAPMSNQIARRVLREFQPHEQTPSDLSPRQRQILDRLAQGFLYKEIAADLGLSEHTVRTHLHNIYEKLQVRTRTEAVMKAFPRP